MNTNYKDHIQILSDTSANLNLANSVLADRELCYESDTGRFKLGDGSLPYSNLDYIDQDGIHYLKSYTVAQAQAITAADARRGMIWVSDETGGAQPAYCDGTNFRRFSDGAIIS